MGRPARSGENTAAGHFRLNAESVRIVNAPQVKTLMLRDGLESVGGTPEEFAAIIKAEVAKWMKLAKVAGIKAD